MRYVVVENREGKRHMELLNGNPFGWMWLAYIPMRKDSSLKLSQFFVDPSSDIHNKRVESLSDSLL